MSYNVILYHNISRDVTSCYAMSYDIVICHRRKRIERRVRSRNKEVNKKTVTEDNQTTSKKTQIKREERLGDRRRR